MLRIQDEFTWKGYLADQIWNALPASSMKIRTRGQINFRCPICGDSKKSATKKRGFYYIDTASYYCFNCEINLTGLQLLKQIAPESIYHEAIVQFKGMKLASLGKGNISYEEMVPEKEDGGGLVKALTIPAWKILCNTFGWEAPTALTEDAQKYLQRRNVLERCDGFLSIKSPSGTPFIIIPYRFNGDCIFYQLHNYTGAETKQGVATKYIFPSSADLDGQEKPVFNIDAVDPSWPFVIGCEGVYDALSYYNGVSFGGKAITDYHLQMLSSRWPHHKIVVALDNDDVGRATMRKICKKYGDRFMYLDTKQLFDLAHAKDANDFIRSGDKAKKILTQKAILERLMKTSLQMQVQLSLF